MYRDDGTDRSLTAALRAVARDEERLEVSAAVGETLAAEVRSIASARRRRTAIVVGLATAAVVAVAMLLPRRPAGEFQAADANSGGAGAADGAREVTTEFFPLAYSYVPAPDGHVIRLQVPRTALVSFGVTSFDAPGSRSTTVLADVVVGDDGLARAVRFVRTVGANGQ